MSTMEPQQPPNEGRMRLAHAVAQQVARGGRVESQTDQQAVLVYGKRPNHILHLILTLVTFGLWAVVWILVALTQKEKRAVITVAPDGQVHHGWS